MNPMRLGFTPVNPDVLRRLSALYRYVLGESDVVSDSTVGVNKKGYPDLQQFKAWVARDAANKVAVDTQFICDYPLAEPSSPAGQTAAMISTKITTRTAGGAPKEVTTTGPDTNAGGSIKLTVSCLIDGQGHKSPRTINVKASVLDLPNCIVCLDGTEQIVASQKRDDDNVAPASQPPVSAVAATPPDVALKRYALYVNPNLRFGLITRVRIANDGKSENAYLGHGFYGLVDRENKNPHRDFHEFELFVDTAALVQNAAGGTAGGSNQKLLSVPISPNGFLLK
jgi:hypothetical protein